MNNLLGLVDFDGLLYHASKETLEDSIFSLKDRVNNIIEKTNCDFWAGFVGGEKCFRYDIFPQYKANRTQAKPKWYRTLKAWSIEEYNLNICNGFESDDAVNYWNNIDLCIDTDFERIETRDTFESALQICNDEKYDGFLFDSLCKVICSPDKDILENISGRHFNYSYKLLDKNNLDSVEKGWFVNTTDEEAEFNKWKQVLKGDSADGVSGLPGIGEVKAIKILQESILAYSLNTLSKYIDFYQNEASGIYEFQKNYRLLHILKDNDDFMREVGHLPEFPKINKVNKVVKEVIDF